MESVTSEPQINVFEVFKLKSIPKSSLENMNVDQIRAKYTVLKSISSLDDIKDVDTIATLPHQDHMVVDKTKFQEMLASKVKQQVDKEVTRLSKQQQETIESLKTAASLLFDEERKRLDNTIRKEIATETSKTQATITQLLSDVNPTLKDSILQILELQKKNIDSIFDNPLRFIDAKEVAPKEEKETK